MSIKNIPIDKKKMSIVLTATIIPNSTYVVHNDSQIRKQEYLDAIHYYRKFAHVFFLENSRYDIFKDSDFINIDNVSIRKLPVSNNYHKGKGYQEFEMINQWITYEKNLPKNFIKISGRYIIKNFKFVFLEAIYRKNIDIIIDRIELSKMALTQLFAVKTDFYKMRMMKMYLKCDDQKGAWAEKVLYSLMSKISCDSCFFINRPIYEVISGSTGSISSEKNIIKITVKQLIRLYYYTSNKKTLKKRNC